MENTVIAVEKLSKAYQIGQIGTGTVSHDLERFIKMRILKQEDPFLKIGEANDRSKKGNSNIVWSLRDLNFSINQGEAVGIIGKNGAGKSTLLKLLSRVTAPTTGEIKVKGRIASLLEVGTGFHPELSGRENIFLNGAILGMRKSEIARKLDEIIDFSGVERYIDTPVKRYSSGMYVRLAFAVAAHLESEILIVDEVLAVGDAEFQKKCLGKMGDISKGEGRTVLFVSHNMAAVKTLCNKGMVLENGAITFKADAESAINHYLSTGFQSQIRLGDRSDRYGSKKLLFQDVELLNSVGQSVSQVFVGENIKLRLKFEQNASINWRLFTLSIIFYDKYENMMASFPSDEIGHDFSNVKDNTITLNIPFLGLRPNEYQVSIYSFEGSTRQEDSVDVVQNVFTFEVLPDDIYDSGKAVRSMNCAFFKSNYQ